MAIDPNGEYEIQPVDISGLRCSVDSAPCPGGRATHLLYEAGKPWAGTACCDEHIPPHARVLPRSNHPLRVEQRAMTDQEREAAKQELLDFIAREGTNVSLTPEE